MDGDEPVVVWDHPRIRGEHDGLPLAEWRRADHPRIRGEHAALDVEGLAALGSSPHTRGARDDVVVRLVHIGIIPAYAGSTSQ